MNVKPQQSTAPSLRRLLPPRRCRQSGATLILAVLVGACAPTNDRLERGFARPPAEARPRTWWHWVNGNVTAEGAVRDLAWMKRVGIGGVQLFEGSLGTPQLVGERLVWMSPAWQAALRTSIATANRLGLDVQVASSPGWSASGAPFVAPADAMKKLVWSRIAVSGGQPLPGPLPAPPAVAGPFQDVPAAESGAPSLYRDIAVLAFPTVEPTLPDPSVTDGVGRRIRGAALADARFATAIDVPVVAGDGATLRFDFGRSVAVAELTLGVEAPHGFGAPPAPEAIVEASDNGSAYRQVAIVPPNAAQVGSVGFAPVTARHLRIRFVVGTGGMPPVAPGVIAPPPPPPPAAIKVTEARFAATPQIDRWVEKAGFATMADYRTVPTSSAVDAVAVAPERVVDLTGRLRADGTLDWTPPTGNRWTILRLGYSLTGKHNGPAPAEATGLEVDKLDASAVRRYADTYIDLYAGAVGKGLIGAHGITGIVSDSIEAGPQNWTPGMIAAFCRLRGYDPTPFLPALTGVPIGSAAASDRFLWDYRRTIADLLAEAHYATLADASHHHGLSYYAEALEDHRPMLGDDLAMRSHADVPMGAMWYPGGTRTTLIADLQGAASVASVYGKRFVGSETFTAFGAPFAQAPRDLRATADLAFALGVNRVMIHTSPHQPFADRRPGMMLMPLLGQNFTRNETWAEMATGWTDYLARSSWLLQQGRRAADVAWFVGEDAPVTALYGDTPFAGLPMGQSFDFVSADGLERALAVDAGGGLVSRGGARYRLLALDGAAAQMTLATLRRIETLVRGGAIVAGARPTGSPSRADDPAAWQAMVDRLWDGPWDKGRVYPSVDAGLTALALAPDWQAGAGIGRDDLAVTHRILDHGDLWFVANRRGGALATDMSFRVTGLQPELWDAVTGARRPAGYRIEGGRTIVPLALAADDSTFVVFRAPARAARRTTAPTTATTLTEWRDGWTLALGDAPPIALDGLPSWTSLPAPTDQYFSGIGRYTRTVTVPAAWLRDRTTLMLDPGTVADVAEVRVNGRSAGIAWANGQRLAIGRWLHAGANRIEIRVANAWVNRLIGDAQPGAAQTTFTSGPTWRGDAPLRLSGLLSPVRLVREK